MSRSRPIHLRLAEVRLERFKAAFKPLKPIVFHPFTAIIGHNGAGKSTVLEALQWIDTAIRQDIRKACDRYNGIHDLINLRSSTRPRSFSIGLKWECVGDAKSTIDYSLKVGEVRESRTPIILTEELNFSTREFNWELIDTDRKGGRRIIVKPGELSPFEYGERLLLGTAITRETGGPLGEYLDALRRFWSQAVFLRLSPNEMAQTTPATQLSWEPMLNETGRSLPALLRRMSEDQLRSVVEAIQRILPDFVDVEVSKPIIPQGDIYYSLIEMMPYPGRTGRKRVEVPAWMLSEGTRRITAILSVLRHSPPPSFLCVEEIENGLDPWSGVEILDDLKAAAERDVQVAVTSHSPWLLDHVHYEDIIRVEREEGETVYGRFEDRAKAKAYRDRIPPGSVFVRDR